MARGGLACGRCPGRACAVDAGGGAHRAALRRGGVGFHLAVDTVTEWRAAYPQLIAALPVMGLAIVALYKATGTEGLGTNDVLDAVQDGKPVKPLLLPAIFLGTVLTHLAGGSAGREGAALQMGGDIGWQAGGLFRLADHERRAARFAAWRLSSRRCSARRWPPRCLP